MTDQDWMEVEVPVNSTVIVEAGEVHGIESDRTDYVLCKCRDGIHKPYDRTHDVSPGQPPHMVGIQTVVRVWTHVQPERPTRKKKPAETLTEQVRDFAASIPK